MSSRRASVKVGHASLVGGIAVAIASFVLWAAVAHELHSDSVVVLLAGAVVSLAIGTWIRVADL